jgi:hypothetical protein
LNWARSFDDQLNLAFFADGPNVKASARIIGDAIDQFLHRTSSGASQLVLAKK